MTRSTTVIVVRRDGKTAMAGDGQVSIDDTIVKGTASKVRTMRDGEVIAGYAGAAADALALFERLEACQAVADRQGPAPARGAAAGGR